MSFPVVGVAMSFALVIRCIDRGVAIAALTGVWGTSLPLVDGAESAFGSWPGEYWSRPTCTLCAALMVAPMIDPAWVLTLECLAALLLLAHGCLGL